MRTINSSRTPAITLIASVLVMSMWSPAQGQERVQAIKAPASTLPQEAESKGVTKFSFIAYGDTRGRRDGKELQYEHSVVLDSMIKQIKNLGSTDYPVRFVLQSGDAVQDGLDVKQWNVSFVPLIDRLTTEGGVPYFLVPGNHEKTTTDVGMKNYMDAVGALIPEESSSRRLKGHATFSFGYGNIFVVGLDANIAGDDAQYNWVKAQLETIDRNRFTNVIVFCHQAPFSSGPHGGPKVEEPTVQLRNKYMPLFNAQHVRVVFSGHEHLFEHWVERYTDSSGAHRMDLIVSGGGGAPIYAYTGEPNLDDYLAANKAADVKLEHLVKPSVDRGLNPYHYVLVRVDGDKLDMQVVSVDWGAGFKPYRSNEVSLQDQ